MNKKLINFKKVAILSLALTSTFSFAEVTNGTMTNAGISIVPQYDVKKDADFLQANYCDPAVYQGLYEKWKQNALVAINNTRNNETFGEFRDQAAPATNPSGSCGFNSVFGPINQIGKQASTIMAIMQGKVDWSQIQNQVSNQIANQACSYANNLAGNAVQNVTAPLNSATGGGLNTFSNTLNGASSFNTPIGQISTNVGSQVVQSASQTAGNPDISRQIVNSAGNAVKGLIN